MRYLLFVILIASVCNATVFFQSDFECGQTYTAHKLKPGQRTIELCPTHELKDWPAAGGKGIIEFNLPAASDTFTYKERIGLLLKGVRGLTKPHPKWANIRTSGFHEWSAGKGPIVPEARKHLSIETSRPLQGAYSAAFNCNSDVFVQLIQPFPGTSYNRLFVRFLVSFSETFLSQEWRGMPFAFWTGNGISSPRLGLQGINNAKEVRFAFLAPPKGRILELQYIGHSSGIIAGKAYCVEIGFEHTEENRLTSRLWVDGELVCKAQSEHSIYENQSSSFAVGKNSHRRQKGTITFDRIAVATNRLGVIPQRPKIAFKEGKLHSSNFDLPAAFANHAASHWQIAVENTWILPLLNTGRDLRNLTTLPHPNVLLLADSLNPHFRFDRPFPVPVPAKPGQSCLARVRRQAQNGSWSSWSTPCTFSMPDHKPAPLEKAPILRDAWFSVPGETRGLKYLRKNTWYDLHVQYQGPAGPFGSQEGFVDLFWSRDIENSTANFASRGGRFHSRGNYYVGFAFGAASLFTKQEEGSAAYTELFGTKGLYCDASFGGFTQDLEKGLATMRVRLLEDAKDGIWRLSAYAKDTARAVSPMYQTAFFVSNDGEAIDQGSHYHWMIAAAVFLALAIAAGIYTRTKRAQRPDEEAEEGVSLDFDSPYDERIRTAQDYILENYTTPISPKDVAQAIGVSPNWLSKFFKRGTGKTVVEYLIELRIQEAKRLLEETKLDISQVAQQSGFVSMTHFRQLFRDFTEMSPVEYRKSIQ